MAVLSYLRWSLRDEGHRAEFERDLEAMLHLAREQPGFRWGEAGRTVDDPLVYVAVSEWDEVDQVRAWEHHPEHEGLYEKWETRYREDLIHRRFVPWVRPPG